ncbi:MAG: hypothetical protein MHM6MM_005629 [Cercozoa sp. M6MM]
MEWFTQASELVPCECSHVPGEVDQLVSAVRSSKRPSDIVLTGSVTEAKLGFDFTRIPDTEVVFEHSDYSVAVNVSPLSRGHLLFLPHRSELRPQVLNATELSLFLRVFQRLNVGTLGGFNSLGAGASVNHLHFHLLPPGSVDFNCPLAGVHFRKYSANQVEDIMCTVSDLQEANIPHNLIFFRRGQVESEVCVLPRSFASTQPTHDRLAAFLEFGGTVVVPQPIGTEELHDYCDEVRSLSLEFPTDPVQPKCARPRQNS